MKKVLFVSHVANFSKFNIPLMKWFHEQGWQVHYASQGEENIPCCDKQLLVPFHRSPLHIGNILAYRIMRQILEQEHYDIVHCHTPTGGVITRLAAYQTRKRGTKIVYTAHGFHFYKGAPIHNWLFYFSAEKFLAHCTDCLITINEEDFQNAQKYSFAAKQIVKIPGAGVDINRFCPVSREVKLSQRKAAGIPLNSFVLIYVAEFIPRKDHPFLLKAIVQIKKQIPEMQLLLVGTGKNVEKCRRLAAKLDLQMCVHFLGYRRDVEKLYQMADVAVSASRQEGLPMNVLEAMACGLPVICTKIRGHIDLIQNGESGFLFPPSNLNCFINALQVIKENESRLDSMKRKNEQTAKQYGENQVVKHMESIYQNL